MTWSVHFLYTGSSSSSTQCEILVRTPVTPDASTPIRKTKKRYHYVGDFTEDDMHIPSKARKVLRIAKRHTESNRKKIRFLRQEKNRLEKRVASLKIILNELKKKPLLSDSDDNISQVRLDSGAPVLEIQVGAQATLQDWKRTVILQLLSSSSPLRLDHLPAILQFSRRQGKQSRVLSTSLHCLCSPCHFFFP